MCALSACRDGIRAGSAEARLGYRRDVMQRLETLVPPPALAAAIGVLMWLAAPPLARQAESQSVRLGLAAAMAAAGAAIALAGIRAFRRARTTIDPHRPQRASTLVTGGIYRLTRNPMYVGVSLVLVGLCAWLWWGPALAGPLLFVAYITRFQIMPEERALHAAFGDRYDAYRRRVRRWL